MWHVSFSEWLISLSIMAPGSSTLSKRVRCPSFLWPNSIALCKWTAALLSTHPLMGVGCFQILAVVNNAAVNMRVHGVFQISVSDFFICIPRSGIAGS